MATAEERFIEKYEETGSGCWLWTAGKMPNGYGQFRYSPKKNGYAHRFAYELHIGPIPTGSQLHHICGVRHCVNPEHLELLTPREHVLERDPTSAAKNAAKTHCPKGHPYDLENTYVNPTTRRRTCRTCQREWRDAHHEDLKEYNRDYWRTRYGRDLAFADRHRSRARAAAERRRAGNLPDPPS